MIAPMIELGKSDAAAVIALGEGAVFDLLRQWKDDSEMKEMHKEFT